MPTEFRRVVFGGGCLSLSYISLPKSQSLSSCPVKRPPQLAASFISRLYPRSVAFLSRISAFGTFRTSQPDSGMPAVGGRTEVVIASPDFRVWTHKRHAAKRRTRLISAGEQMGTGGVAVCCGVSLAALRFRPYGPAPTYWITRSARLSTSGGIVTPMSRAVLRSTISS